MARFLRTETFTGEGACSSLREREALPYDVPAFKSFVVHGPNERPMRIDLYKSGPAPLNERPTAVLYRDDDGLLQLQTQQPKGKQ